MDLFILRHGEAARQAPTDQERCLTERGQEELHAVLSQCRGELAGVAHMFVSPYVRAQQTSRIAAEYLPPAVVARTSELLVPEAAPLKLMAHLQQWRQNQASEHPTLSSAVLLVSHQPLVGNFLNLLCGFAVGRYSMGTSALAAVEAEVIAAGLGDLRWLRQPGDFR